MHDLVPFPKHPSRRYDVYKIEDATLTKIGISPGEEFVVAWGEFRPGDFHVVESGGGARVLILFERPPNLLGRVLPPPADGDCALPLEGVVLHWRAGADGAHELTKATRLGLELAHCNAEEWQGWGWVNFLHPKDRDPFVARWQESIATGKPYRNRGRFRLGGLWVNMTVAGEATRDGSGLITGWTGTFQVEEVESAEDRRSA